MPFPITPNFTDPIEQPIELDRDILTIAQNLRDRFVRYNEKRNDARKTWSKVASEAGINRTTLAKAAGGKRYLTEPQLLLVAQALGIHPGRLLDGVRDRSRYKHVPLPTNRGAAGRMMGQDIRRVEQLLTDSALLSAFFGGVTDADLPEFREKLTEMRNLAAQKRATIAQEGRTGEIDPLGHPHS